MKTKIMMMTAALMLVMAANGDNKKVTPSIKHVTVFTNGAQVERSLSVNLLAGEQVITFTGLSPYTDVKSMQIKARGKLTVLGVNYRTIHPDSLQRVKQLREAEKLVKSTDEKERELKAQLEVVNAQLEMVKTNSSIGNRTTVTPLANIKELNNYYAQETLELKKKAIAIDQELEKLAEIREKQEKTVDSIARIKLKTMTEADLTLQVAQAGKVEFDLTYYVRNAGWYPTYDLRSEGLGLPLQLSYKANMFQNTKEEWNNISVTLSSANPSRSNIAPELRTYWIDYGKLAPRYDNELGTEGSVSGVVLDEEGEPLIGCSVMVVGTSLGTVTDVNGRYSIALPRGKNQLRFAYVGYLSQTSSVNGSTLNVRMKEDSAALQEVVVIGYGVSKKGRGKTSRKREDASMIEGKVPGVAVSKEPEMPESELIAVNEQRAQFGYEFEIKQPLTLLSDGKTTTTEIARYQLPATYQYLGIPRADKDAFLVADATGWGELNLVEGEAMVFYDNSYVGKTILSPVESDTLHLSLGRDNGIQIERKLIKNNSVHKVLSGNQTQQKDWEISVRNTRSEKVSIKVYDQVPVSQNSDITVTTEELSDGNFNKETGIVVWNLELNPGESRKLRLRYQVKYPKNRRLDIE
jgi:hypothetical protein